MKLTELKKPDGTYAGVRFSQQTQSHIADYMKEHSIPNPLPTDKMHTTLLYSRKYLPEYEPAGEYSNPLVGKPVGFEVWDTQPDEDGETSRCLVLRYDCPDLKDRHHSLMDEHDATFDYDEFKPHITFSYSIGDTNIDGLPSFNKDIEITHEYGEDLNLSWAKDNS